MGERREHRWGRKGGEAMAMKVFALDRSTDSLSPTAGGEAGKQIPILTYPD